MATRLLLFLLSPGYFTFEGGGAELWSAAANCRSVLPAADESGPSAGPHPAREEGESCRLWHGVWGAYYDRGGTFSPTYFLTFGTPYPNIAGM